MRCPVRPITPKADPHQLLVTNLVENNRVNITMSSISTTIDPEMPDPIDDNSQLGDGDEE